MKAGVTRLRQLVLLAGDIACFVVGLMLALNIRYGIPVPRQVLAEHIAPFAIIFSVWLLIFYIGNLYSLRHCKNNRAFFELLASMFGINVGISVLFFYFIPYFSISPKTVLFLDLGTTAVLLALWRVFFNRFASVPFFKMAMLGEGGEVEEILDDLKKNPQQGIKCVLHFKDAQEMLARADGIIEQDIDIFVAAVDYHSSPALQKALFELSKRKIAFYDFVDFYEQHLQKVPLPTIDWLWFLENLNESGKQVFSFVKRGYDIFLSVIFGAVGVILFPFIALAILIESGSPIFYSQMRIGQFGKPFKIYKFRSMKKEDDENSVTRVGKFLRASHLDEIPQIWNIIKGEMSYVGPRPERIHLVEDLKSKIPFYTERLLVRPGIMGWAQLHEPKARVEDALEKLQYDLFYVKHRSLFLDFEIIWKTFRILIPWLYAKH